MMHDIGVAWQSTEERTSGSQLTPQSPRVDVNTCCWYWAGAAFWRVMIFMRGCVQSAIRAGPWNQYEDVAVILNLFELCVTWLSITMVVRESWPTTLQRSREMHESTEICVNGLSAKAWHVLLIFIRCYVFSIGDPWRTGRSGSFISWLVVAC